RTVDDVAELVRDRRKQLGLSQMELARRAGVSRQWLVDLERGKPTAEVSLVLRTLAAAGMQLDARDPMHYPEGSQAAAVIDAGREVLERHRPAGTPLRTLSTRAPRAPSSGSIRAPKREP
ncbi:MAG TPA: helix-turn-helix domain-containing protein, partial [Longimicrobium sp.]|nr:helix-turn-helix domain-containing protein [Longimicrobium sp.]